MDLEGSDRGLIGVLSRHFHGVIEENHEKPKSASRPIFESEHYRYNNLLGVMIMKLYIYMKAVGV
jgi:hypothetical protein